jgi:hypothetical protein
MTEIRSLIKLLRKQKWLLKSPDWWYVSGSIAIGNPETGEILEEIPFSFEIHPNQYEEFAVMDVVGHMGDWKYSPEEVKRFYGYIPERLRSMEGTGKWRWEGITEEVEDLLEEILLQANPYSSIYFKVEPLPPEAEGEYPEEEWGEYRIPDMVGTENKRIIEVAGKKYLVTKSPYLQVSDDTLRRLIEHGVFELWVGVEAEGRP